jgi:hypothetical protein
MTPRPLSIWNAKSWGRTSPSRAAFPSALAMSYQVYGAGGPRNPDNARGRSREVCTHRRISTGSVAGS